MGNYTVYRHITPDGKSYVGCTSKTIKERWWEKYNHNLLFSEAIKRYGWDGMEHEIIAENLDEDEAYKIEIETIKKYKSNDPQYGFNISKGGKATFKDLKHTEVTKQKMSDSNKGRIFSEEHCANLSKALKGLLVGEKNPMYGKQKSRETIKKQYESHKHQMKKVIQKDMNGNILNIFFSIHEASRQTGINRTCINNCATGKQKSSKGFIWEYERR